MLVKLWSWDHEEWGWESAETLLVRKVVLGSKR